MPNVPDFRLCCRTYTCGWLAAFLYWNLQYDVEHHMFPAVPFYNLPASARRLSLPPAPALRGRSASASRSKPEFLRRPGVKRRQVVADRALGGRESKAGRNGEGCLRCIAGIGASIT